MQKIRRTLLTISSPAGIHKRRRNSAARKQRTILLERRKNDIILLLGDFQGITPDSQYKLSEKAIDVAIQHDLKRILTLGGLGTGEISRNPRVFGATTTLNQVEELKKYGVIFKGGGAIFGAAGLLLGLGMLKGIPAACLMGETHGQIIDAKSAEAVLKVHDTDPRNRDRHDRTRRKSKRDRRADGKDETSTSQTRKSNGETTGILGRDAYVYKIRKTPHGKTLKQKQKKSRHIKNLFLSPPRRRITHIHLSPPISFLRAYPLLLIHLNYLRFNLFTGLKVALPVSTKRAVYVVHIPASEVSVLLHRHPTALAYFHFRLKTKKI